MSILIRDVSSKSWVENFPVELVERKGLGHPDTVIDAIMEKISVNLSKEYLEEFGSILHHNVDKGLIVGGESIVGYGRGTITKPIEVYLAGRALSRLGGRVINVDGIAMETARNYLESNFKNLEVDEDVVLVPKIREGAADLKALVNNKVPLSNDTSFGVGFAPYSTLESIVYRLENYLNDRKFKLKFPYVGEDIKVMGYREGDIIKLTIAIAFVSSYISDLHDYVEKKEKIRGVIDEYVKSLIDGNYTYSIYLNVADDYKNDRVYITKTGLSMENGDDGQVGRGNRVSGLITPYRKLSLEAPAGKNPVNHVGKIYNVLASEMAKDLVRQYDFLESVEITILSQIGAPINYPLLLDSNVVLAKGYSLEDIKNQVNYIIDAWLENIDEITEMIIYGRTRIY